MKFALIGTDGTLGIRDGQWAPELGPEGSARVPLHPSFPLTGWVNAIGLLWPEKYPRNVTGAVLLCVLGAPHQPYAGQVVITGWSHGCDIHEPTDCDLDDQAAGDLIPALHRDIGLVLAGEKPLEAGCPAEWGDAVRMIAEIARDGAVPPVQLITMSGGLN